MSKEVLKHLLASARVDDEFSLLLLQRALQRHGLVVDEMSLNKRIISHLLAKADPEDGASLRLLCQELVSLGYGPQRPSVLSGEKDTLVLDVLKIKPVVQGNLAGKGSAFVWELDRDCENLDWLTGAKVEVDGHPFLVQGIENAGKVADFKKGEKLTLLCKSLHHE